MGYSIPGVEDPQEEAIGSSVIRQVTQDVLTFNPEYFVEGVVGNLFGISRGWFLMCIFTGLMFVLWHQIPNLPQFALAWVVGTAPLWLLPVSVAGGWKAWIWYVRSNYIAGRKGILLEMKMPRDLVKSPRGMEVALSHLWVNSGVTTYIQRMYLGQVRPFFSLEIASFGGEVHFYVWTWKNWRHVVEAAIYSQYPEVELVEVEDYATKFVFDPKKCTVYATDHRYEPRNDAYPIKTYVDFELDKDPKEEYKVDPLAIIIEHLSGLRPDEQVWLQITFTICEDTRHKPGGKWWETQNRYVGLLSDEVDKIREQAIGKFGTPETEWKRYVRIQYYKQTEQIRTIERNLSKHPFNTRVTGMYLCDPDKYGAQGWNPGIRWIWRPFGNPQYANQLRPRRWHPPFDFPHQDLWDMRWNLATRRFFDCYRRRNGFYAPWTIPYNMMSSEVIASLWHPISSAIASTGIERIPAKKAAPPPNLPK